jgi:hypothetical protein
VLDTYGIPFVKWLHDYVVCPFDHYLMSWLILFEEAEPDETPDCNVFCPCDVGA